MHHPFVTMYNLEDHCVVYKRICLHTLWYDIKIYTRSTPFKTLKIAFICRKIMQIWKINIQNPIGYKKMLNCFLLHLSQ